MKSLIPHFLVGLALVFAASFVGLTEKVVAQTNLDVFYVYTNCNVYPCTIGVAVHNWATPPGWRKLSQSYVGGARAWRAACHFHFDNPRYNSPDIANGVVNCVEMRRQAAILDRGGSASAVRNSCPGTAVSLRGTSELISCSCSAGDVSSGRLWGVGPYTDDSDICRAALHAGAVGAGGGVISFRPSGGLSSYPGSTSNGVTSTVWPRPWHGSFIF